MSDELDREFNSMVASEGLLNVSSRATVWCWFGVHHWSMWSQLEEEIFLFTKFSQQTRRCLACNRQQRRRT